MSGTGTVRISLPCAYAHSMHSVCPAPDPALRRVWRLQRTGGRERGGGGGGGAGLGARGQGGAAARAEPAAYAAVYSSRSISRGIARSPDHLSRAPLLAFSSATQRQVARPRGRAAGRMHARARTALWIWKGAGAGARGGNGQEGRRERRRAHDVPWKSNPAPPRATPTSHSLRRALLTPQVNPGSLYRCGKGT